MLYTYIGTIVWTYIYSNGVYIYFKINMPLIDLTIDIMAVDESCLKVVQLENSSNFLFFTIQEGLHAI